MSKYNDLEIISKLNETISEKFIDTPLKQYIKEITQYKLLTPNEEIKIATKVANGDKKAKEFFINSNLRLVVDIAKHYIGHGLPFLDLIQEGNIGLMKAVDKFDVSKGYKFSTYATWWIKAEISRTIDNQARTIRVPIHMKETIKKLNHTQEQLNSDLDHEPSKEELANALNISKKNISLALESRQNIVSLSQQVFTNKNGDEINIEETIEDPTTSTEKEIDEKSFKNEIEKVINELDDIEKKIVKLTFGIGCSEKKQVDIATILGVSESHVSITKGKALLKLKNIILENKYITTEAELSVRQKKERKHTKKTIDLLVSEFPQYTKEQILEAINRLTNKDKKIIKLYYYLDEYESISLEERNRLLSMETNRASDSVYHIKKRIQQRIENNELKVQTIFELYSEYNKEQVLNAINSLDEENKKIIELKYGLNGNDIHDNTEIAKIFNTTNKKIKNRISLAKNHISTKLIIIQFESIINFDFKKNKKYIKTLINMLNNPTEQAVLLLRLGYVKGKYYNEHQIVKYLNISENEVIKSTKHGLTNLNNILTEKNIEHSKQKNLVKS